MEKGETHLRKRTMNCRRTVQNEGSEEKDDHKEKALTKDICKF